MVVTGFANFNSILVQLEVVQDFFLQIVLINFNSILVQLEDEIKNDIETDITLFQFHIGAIRRPGCGATE